MSTDPNPVVALADRWPASRILQAVGYAFGTVNLALAVGSAYYFAGPPTLRGWVQDMVGLWWLGGIIGVAVGFLGMAGRRGWL